MLTMKKRTIKTVLILLGIILGIWCCNNTLKMSKDRHQHTEKLSNGIFKEKFETFSGGVLMTNDYSYYVTDSTTFRKFIGDCDEKEIYRCIVLGDTIRAIKYSRRIHYGKDTPIDSVFFSIKALKKDGVFN